MQHQEQYGGRVSGPFLTDELPLRLRTPGKYTGSSGPPEKEVRLERLKKGKGKKGVKRCSHPKKKGGPK